MKQCSQCRQVKELDLFFKCKKDTTGYGSECKECNNAYKRSPEGLSKVIFRSQLNSSIYRGHPEPTYTRIELYQWIVSQPTFNKLFMNWVSSNYNKNLTPSCDRLDDYLPYSLNNLQLITWEDNRSKAGKDKKEGRNNKINKAVIQLSLEGNFIQEYFSISEAAR